MPAGLRPLVRRLGLKLLSLAPEPTLDEASRHAAWGELERLGPIPLTGEPLPEGPLALGFVLPEFRRASGGHATIAHLARALAARGHRTTLWLDDPLGRSGGAERFRAFFGAGLDVRDDLAGWSPPDVAIATGWQTVASVLRRPARSRAYLVQDLEPEFYPASAERLWAQRSYEHGLPAITAGAWLAQRLGGRAFDLGIDHGTYRPLPGVQRRPRVLFYARAATPRRAVPLGLLALAELRTRRPDLEIATFGDPAPPGAPFGLTHLGILDGPALARAYGEASVGLVLSLTNHSLVAQEMAACGLPVVELRTSSTLLAFSEHGPITLAEATPTALADALERPRPAQPGWGAERTWARAAQQVEAALRAPAPT